MGEVFEEGQGHKSRRYMFNHIQKAATGQHGPAFTSGYFKGFCMRTKVGTDLQRGVWPCGLKNGSLLPGEGTK